MESHGDEESDYNNSVIDNLVNMFGHILTKEVITTLVESLAGDLNLCVDAITEITNNGNMIPKDDIQPSTSQNTKPNTTSQQTQPLMSYARTAQSTGAVPKEPQRTVAPRQYFWTDQIRKIITHYNNGSRVMIILRGLPGSGKSHLARLLVESLVGPSFVKYKSHVFSSDDYFMVRGKYQYDKSYISNAHLWNQDRVRQSAIQGLSLIIIDNTNIETWEMRPYVIDGVENGYIIEIVEPMTPWAKKPKQLFNMNVHNVPLHKIKRMLDNFVENITAESLMHSFGLSYPANMVPPNKQLISPIPTQSTSILTPNFEVITTPENIQDEPRSQLLQSPMQPDRNSHEQPESINASGQECEVEPLTVNISYKQKDKTEYYTISDENELSEEEQAKQKNILEAQKRLEELQKFEEDWENGEKWDEHDTVEGGTTFVNYGNEPFKNIIASPTTTITPTNATISSAMNITTTLISSLESKPPSEKPVKDSDCETTNKGLMQSVTDCPDWRYISLFMPPWNHPDEQKNFAIADDVPIEKKSSSTCVEKYDTNLSGDHKIITATSRDINELYVAPAREKIPDRRMLDKSTMTNDGIIMTVQCPQKEKHFIAFRNLFKHIKRPSLRYIFDNCCGDAYWAVEHVLGGGAEYKLKSIEDGEVSDSDEAPAPGSDLPCTCLAEYEIIPNESKGDDLKSLLNDEAIEQPTEDSVSQLERKKRVIIVSEENMQLKRQIEQNVVIADNHYSAHCLKIRKIRRGQCSEVGNISEQPSTSGTAEIVPVFDSSNPTASNIYSSDDEDGSGSNISESDKIVNINLGSSFIKELDAMFGRKDMEYPNNIKYNISIPTSLLNEINALWRESMMFQLEDTARRSALMLKQDEEFARQLQLKEQELMLEGKEPDVPDFKEIMDLEMALNLHMKDTSEWRNNVPTDLAAKMTHDKLFNLFPEVKQDTLLEMLMAHDNNFKATVEVLLISLGRDEILESENGLNKFVMEKELQRQERLLEEQKKALSEKEWPPLQKGVIVDMSTVQFYRDNAEKHLARRNIQMQKAEDYIKRGMIQVANYCSEIANFHKTQYEQANSKAVATLIQYHADNNSNGETVDLHYFRVKEAKEAMDLFIDKHIQKLRETNKRSIMLFFITGRGLHSSGRPKVKPACIKRLRERGLQYSECNPGLLRSRVNCDTKLTYQIP